MRTRISTRDARLLDRSPADEAAQPADATGPLGPVPGVVSPIDLLAGADAAASADTLELLAARGVPASRAGASTKPPAAPAPVVATPSPATSALPTVSADQQTVVVLDTGIGSAVGNLLYQYDFYANDADAANTTASNHGSIVASQVLAADADVNLVMLKVAANGSDTISLDAVDRALDWVAANAARLNIAAVNLSFGAAATTSGTAVTSLSDEFAQLARLDVAVVVAAGNSGAKTGVSALAADANAIAVSASDGAGRFASFSNRDADLTDLVADGVGIATATGSVSGTSFAAPLVAGAIAEVKDAFYSVYGREASVAEALGLLQASADTMLTTGEVRAADGTWGEGYAQLDLAGALALVQDAGALALIGINPLQAA